MLSNKFLNLYNQAGQKYSKNLLANANYVVVHEIDKSKNLSTTAKYELIKAFILNGCTVRQVGDALKEADQD